MAKIGDWILGSLEQSRKQLITRSVLLSLVLEAINAPPSHPTLGKEKLSNAQGRGRIDRLGVINSHKIQGSYPFPETNFQHFSRTFQGLRLIFHINSYTPKISMLILLIAFHTLLLFLFS